MQFRIDLRMPAEKLLPVRNFTGGDRFGIKIENVLHGQAVSSWPRGNLGSLQVIQQDFAKAPDRRVAVDRLVPHRHSSLSFGGAGPRARKPSAGAMPGR